MLHVTFECISFCKNWKKKPNSFWCCFRCVFFYTDAKFNWCYIKTKPSIEKKPAIGNIFSKKKNKKSFIAFWLSKSPYNWSPNNNKIMISSIWKNKSFFVLFENKPSVEHICSQEFRLGWGYEGLSLHSYLSWTSFLSFRKLFKCARMCVSLFVWLCAYVWVVFYLAI